jgi:pimeloyl-ACP methyl ester carboxylesterase
MTLAGRIEPLPDGTGARVLLPDGRAIGVRQTGLAQGWPLLLFPGTPGSRLTPLADAAGTREAGARVVVLERPGFGVSTPQPGRRILDWPRDVVHVADALGIGSFAVAGMSGAGPYLAACALALPDRVRAVGMLGVVCPLDAPGIRSAMTLRRRLMYRALPLAPYAVPLLRALGVAGVQRLMTADVPACDKEIIARIAEPYAAMRREAFRQGPAAFATELALGARPWGFRIEDIRVAVQLWHGELDVSTPLAMGRHLAAAIPGCRARFVPGEGHFVAYSRWREILAALAPAVDSSREPASMV